MHNMDANEMKEEKPRWELYKNVTYCFEQILEITPIKRHLYGYLPPISQTIQVRRN